MTAPRTTISAFSTANPLYAGAVVSVYTVDANSEKTSTLATLYAGPVTTTLLANPQTLDGQGKWLLPPYIDVPVIITVTRSGTAVNHDTGVIGSSLADDAATLAQNAANLALVAWESVKALANKAKQSAVAAAAAAGGIKVSGDDTTAGDLETKLLAGDGIALSTQNGGGNETRTAAVDLATDPGLEFSGGDLRAKIKASSGLTRDSDGLWVTTAFQALCRGYIDGLTLSNNSADSYQHDIDVAAGICRDDTNAAWISLSSSITKLGDATFSAGSGNGGFESGQALPTNGTVFAFAIAEAAGTNPDVLLSDQLSPTLPGSYVYKRLIGAFTTDGSANIVRFHQTGDVFKLDTQAASSGDGVLGDLNAHDITLPCPKGVTVQAIIAAALSDGTASASVALITEKRQADQAPAGDLVSLQSGLTTAAQRWIEKTLETDTSGIIRGRASTATANLQVNLVGWIFQRGKNA